MLSLKKIACSVTAVAIVLLLGAPALAAYPYAVTDGDWDDGATWSTGSIPTSSDRPIITGDWTVGIHGGDVANASYIYTGISSGYQGSPDGTATLTIDGGSLSFYYLYMGGSYNNAGRGVTVNHSAGTVSGSGGYFGYWNTANNEDITYNLSGTGVFSLSATSFYLGYLRNGDANTGDVNFNQSGSSIATVGTLYIGSRGSSYAGTLSYNLNGGTLSAKGIRTYHNYGTRNFNFNGGTLAARQDNSSFMTSTTLNAYVDVGGAIIDSAGYNITISTPLLHGGTVTDGGLTKEGLGTLTLSGINTYTGNTTVNGGALVAATTASLPGSFGNVFANSGGTMAVDSSGWTSGEIDALLTDATWAAGSAFGIDTSGGDYTYSSDLTGVIGFGKIGANTLLFSGSNTYAGNTDVYAGTLLAATTGSLPGWDTSGITAHDGGTLAVQVGGGGWTGPQLNTLIGNVAWLSGSGLGVDTTNTNTTISDVISGSVSVVKLGINTLTLTGSNTYTGTTNIVGGTLQIGVGNDRLPTTTAVTLANVAGATLDINGFAQTIASISGGGTSGGDVTLGTGGTLTVGSGDYAGAISGSGSSPNLVKVGTDTLILSGTSTYTGNTHVTAGTLMTTKAASLPGYDLTDHVVVSSGATLGVQIGGGKWGSSEIATLSSRANWAAGSDLNIEANSNSTISGVITGAFRLVKTGSRRLVLTEDNTYTGTTVVEANYLYLGYDTPTGSVVGDIEIKSGAYLYVRRSADLEISSVISGAGRLYMRMPWNTGDGLILSAANTHTGNTEHMAGRMMLKNELALQYSTFVNVYADYFKFDSSVTSNAFTFGGLHDMSQNLVLQNTADAPITLTVGGNHMDTYVGNRKLTGPGTLIKVGTGTLRIYGVNLDHSGHTYVNEGTLDVTFPGPGLLTSGHVTVASGATLKVDQYWTSENVSSMMTSLNWVAGSNFAARIDDNNYNKTYTGNIPAPIANFTKVGNAMLTLSGTNTYTGNTYVDSGTLVATKPDALPGYSVTDKVVVGNANLIVTPSWASSEIDDLLSSASWTSNSNFGIDTNEGDFTYSSNLTGAIGGSGNFLKLGANTLTFTGTNSYTGFTTIEDGTLQLGAGGGTGSIIGNITNKGTLIINRNNTYTLSDVISGSGSLIHTGSGRLSMEVANTYTGTTSAGGGKLTLKHENALQYSTFMVASALEFDGSVTANAFAFGGLSGTQDIALKNKSGPPDPIVLTIGGNNFDTTYSGNFSASGSLTKVGTGMLSLLGSNTYLGNTNVNGGVLSVATTASLPGYDAANRVFVNGSGSILAVRVPGWSNANIATMLANVTFSSGWGIDTSDGDYTYTPDITGARDFAKVGENQLTLDSGAWNTYTGKTYVYGGVLLAPTIFQLVNYTASTGSAQEMIVNGGTLGVQVEAGTVTSPNAWTTSEVNDLGANANWNQGAGAIGIDTTHGNYTYDGNYLASGSKSFTKLGNNTMVIPNSNNFFGVTTIDAGTLRLTNQYALKSSTVDTSGGGILEFGSSNVQYDIGGLQGTSGNLHLEDIDGNPIIVKAKSYRSRAKTTYNGSFTGSGQVRVYDYDTFTLTGTSNSQFTGTFYMQNAKNVEYTSGETNFGDAELYLYSYRFRYIGPGDTTIPNDIQTNFYSSNEGFEVPKGHTVTLAGVVSKRSAVLIGGGRLVLSNANTFGASTDGSATPYDGVMVFKNEFAAQYATLRTGLGGSYEFDSSVASHAFRVGALDGGGDLVLVDNGANPVALTIGRIYNSKTYKGALSGTGSLTFDNTSNASRYQVFFGENTYTGSTTINNGTLYIGNGSANGSIAGTSNIVINGGRLVFRQSDDYTIGSVISGAGGELLQSGDGTLILTNANTFSGTTGIDKGTLKMANQNAISPFSAIKMGTSSSYSNALVFDSSVTGNVTVAGLSGGSASTIDLQNEDAAPIHLAVGGNNLDTTYKGTLSGLGSFTKNGLFGSLTLSGNSGGSSILTYAGSTNLNAGTLAAKSLLPGTTSSGKIVLGNDTTLIVGTGAPGWSETNIDDLMANATWGTDVNFGIDTGVSGGDLAYGGSFVAEIASFTKLGYNTLTLTGTNNYTGATNLNGGTVDFDGMANFGNTSVINFGGGTLRYATGNTDDITTQPVVLATAGTIDTNSEDVTFAAGAIHGSGGFAKTGLGTLTFEVANVYTGNTAVNGSGTLKLAHQNAIMKSTFTGGTGTLVFDSSVGGNAFVFAGLSGASALVLENTAPAAINLTVGGNNVDTTYMGALSGLGSLTKVGTGALLFGVTQGHTGGTTVNDGALAVKVDIGGTGWTSSNVDDLVSNSTWASGSALGMDTNTYGDFTYNSDIAGSMGVIKVGNNTLTLGGTNTFTGDVTIAGGTLAFSEMSNLGNGTAINFNRPGRRASWPYDAPSGRLKYTGATPITITRAIVFNGRYAYIYTADQDVTIDTAIVGADPNVTFRKYDTGKLIFKGANTFGGSLYVSGGTVVLANEYAVQNATIGEGSGQIVFDSTVTSNAFTVGNVNFRDNNVTLENNNGDPIALTFGGNDRNISGDYYNRGSFLGLGSLTKVGTGITRLNRTNTYEGGTTVNSGLFIPSKAVSLPGYDSPGEVVVKSGATLGVLKDGYEGTWTASQIVTMLANVDFEAGASWGIGGYGDYNIDIVDINGGPTGFTYFTGNAGLYLNMTGLKTYTGPTTFYHDGKLDFSSMSDLGMGTAINFYGGTLRYNGNSDDITARTVTLHDAGDQNQDTALANIDTHGSDVTFAGVIVGGGGLRKGAMRRSGIPNGGMGTLTLMAANTYSGPTDVQWGTLVLANENALQNSTFYPGPYKHYSSSDPYNGSLVFDSSVSGNAFTFGGLTDTIAGDKTYTGPIVLNNSAGAGIALTIGNNNEDATYGGDNYYNSYPRNRSGVISGLGSLTKIGTGTQVLSGANTYSGMTTVDGGTLQLNPAARNVVFKGAGVDIKSGRLVFDYTDSGDPAATILSLLKDSYNSGGWDVGQFLSSTATSTVGLGWKDEFDPAVIVQPALYGDATLDGTVNADDLVRLLTAYNQSSKVWNEGDFNYDGTVNAGDLIKLLTNYNQSMPVSGGGLGMAGGITAIPEPSSIAMLASLLALAGLWMVRRRRGAAALLNKAFSLSHGRHSMKHVLILSVCIVLSSAMVANAALIPANVTAGNISVDYERTSYDATYDLVAFYINGFSGSASGSLLTLIEGTWTATGGSFYLSSSGFGWKGSTTNNNFTEPAPPLSYVNFDSYISSGFSRTGSGNLYTPFTGNWYTTETAAKLRPVDPDLEDGFDQTLIGKMYVTKATTGLAYSGLFGYTYDGGTNETTGFDLIPEPSTLALLASGLIGLLCYAWRKRK